MKIEEKIIWHEVIKRQPTEEEKEEHLEAFDCVPEYILDCKMPYDGQEILIVTKYGVDTDICGIDEGYYLENRGDWDDVIAWAEMPKYKVGEQKGTDRMDRKEAVEILRNTPIDIINPEENVYSKYFTAVILAIEALQEPQVGGWIPVSERLPKDCGEDWVLVQIKEKDCGFLWIPRVGEERNGKWWLTDDEEPLEDMFEVIAWQPLPEPYKEERTNDREIDCEWSNNPKRY